MDFDLEEWKGVGDGDLSKELFGSNKGLKTTKGNKRKRFDKENSFLPPSSKKLKSVNDSSPSKQVIERGSKNKRNKYKNYDKVNEMEFRDNYSDKGKSVVIGKGKVDVRNESNRLNKEYEKTGNDEKGKSKNCKKKRKKDLVEPVPKDKDSCAENEGKKRKRKHSVIEDKTVNGKGESNQGNRKKDNENIDDMKNLKKRKKGKSTKEVTVKSGGQSAGNVVGKEGVADEVKKKKRRKKKKKPSSKRNKYKYLDEARKAAREAMAIQGTISTVEQSENNSSLVSGIKEKQGVDCSEVRVLPHKINGKKKKRSKDENIKEIDKAKLLKMNDSVQNANGVSFTEANRKSESSSRNKQMKKTKKKFEDSYKLTSVKIDSSTRASSKETISASFEEGATKRKKKRKKNQEDKNQFSIEHLPDNQSAVTKSNDDQSQKSHKTAFNLKKLSEILQNAESQTSEKVEKQHHKKKNHKTKAEISTNESNTSETLSTAEKLSHKESKKLTLKERMTNQLKAARFRYLNEKLYTQSGDMAQEMFKKDKDSYMVYHDGFQTQVAKWPTNPVDVIIEELKKCNFRSVIADFGCGDAKIAQSLPMKVHSYDLVAINKHVTACNMAKVPLSNSTVDVAVFCLSLMGTNLKDYLTEANRVLKKNGIMKVAEVSSRFNSIPRFLLAVEKFGFKLMSQDDSNKMFVMFDFKKVGAPKTSAPDFKLDPCVYKKR